MSDDEFTVKMREGLERLRRSHRVVDDCWYSCPKSGECCNENTDDSCWCGADAHNAVVDELLALMDGHLPVTS